MRSVIVWFLSVWLALSPAFADGSFVAPTANGTAATGQLPGTTTNDAATAGNVGEILSATVIQGSAVSLVSATAKTITSISLTAGDWDVSGVVYFETGASTNVTQFISSLNVTTDTLSTNAGAWNIVNYGAAGLVFGAQTDSLVTPILRVSTASTISYFLIGRCSFSVSTCTGWGNIRARRVR